MPRLLAPFSVLDLDANAWDEMVRHNRLLQAGNLGAEPSDDSDDAAAPPQPPPEGAASATDAGGDAAATAAASKRDAARAYGAGGLMERLAQGEGTGGDRGYDESFGHGRYYPQGWAKPSQLTLDQWTEVGAHMLRNGSGSSAIGKYQFVPTTLQYLRQVMGLRGDEIATADLQDRMGRELLHRRGYDRYLAGRMTADQLQHELAKEWASVADLSGKSRWNQPVGTTSAEIQAAMAQAKAEADAAGGLPDALAARAWR